MKDTNNKKSKTNHKSTKARTLLYLALNFVIVFGVYRLCIHLRWAWGTVLYLIAAAALSVVYYVVNRGFGTPIRDPALLPGEWNAAKKKEYMDWAEERHRRARGILYWLLPIIVTLMIDAVDIFLLDTLREMIR